MAPDEPEYEFECPRCGETTVVDAGAREMLLDDGCIGCGEEVSTGAFRRVVGTYGQSSS